MPYQLAAALWRQKTAGEADSFPCRLITNYLSIPTRTKGEAPVLAAAAVTEFDAAVTVTH